MVFLSIADVGMGGPPLEPQPATMQHMLSCQRGGSPSIRHNKIRDIIENLLSNDVRVEPELQELTTEELSGRTANTTNGARLDITINGFWGGRFELSILDIRVLNSYTLSNRRQELEKKRAYSQRVREIEHASFTPLVLSGLAKEATP